MQVALVSQPSYFIMPDLKLDIYVCEELGTKHKYFRRLLLLSGKKENLVLFDFPGVFWHVNSSGLEIKRWSLRELCWLNERFKVQGWKTYKVITVIQGLEWILTFETTQLSLIFIPWCLQVWCCSDTLCLDNIDTLLVAHWIQQDRRHVFSLSFYENNKCH